MALSLNIPHLSCKNNSEHQTGNTGLRVTYSVTKQSLVVFSLSVVDCVLGGQLFLILLCLFQSEQSLGTKIRIIFLNGTIHFLAYDVYDWSFGYLIIIFLTNTDDVT